jgi:hypothetical protein
MSKYISTLKRIEIWFPIIFTVFANVIAITIWGIKLQDKMDYLAQDLNRHMSKEEVLLSNINSLWSNVIVINSKLTLQTIFPAK